MIPVIIKEMVFLSLFLFVSVNIRSSNNQVVVKMDASPISELNKLITRYHNAKSGLSDKDNVLEYIEEVGLATHDANNFIIASIRKHAQIEEEYSRRIRQNYPEGGLGIILMVHQLQVQTCRIAIAKLEVIMKQLEDFYFYEYGFRNLQSVP